MTLFVAKDKPWLQICGVIVYGTTCTMYGITSLINPGIEMTMPDLDSDLDALVEEKRICNICSVVKTDRDTFHCDDCDVCIKSYDHHCPWTGKCIGANNIYPFYAWLVSIIVALLFSVLVVAVSVKFEVRHGRHK